MNNGRPLNEREIRVVEDMKSQGVLLKLDLLSDEWGIGLVRDAVSFLCSDDYTDMTALLREVVAAYVHPVRFFGGPLLLSSSYRRFDEGVRDWVIDNIQSGMEHIKTDVFIPKFHWPCGMGDKHGHSLEAILKMIMEAKEYLDELAYFQNKRMPVMFHTRRINGGGEMVQNTYLLKVPLLTEYLNNLHV